METITLAKPRVCFEFEVEKIIGVSGDGNFQVQWAPSWVSRFNLTGCENLIQEFLQRQQQRQSECHVTEPHEAGPLGIKRPRIQVLPQQQSEMRTEPETEEKYGIPDTAVGLIDQIGDQNFEIPYTQCGSQLPIVKTEIGLGLENIDMATNTPTSLEHLSEPTISASDEVPVLDDDGHCLIDVDNLPSNNEHCNRIQAHRRNANKADETNTPNITSNLESRPRPKRRLSAKKGYSCPDCGKKFNNKSNMNRHVRLHSGDRPYPCMVCDYRSALKSGLKVHMRTHTGEKPYCCDRCGKRFATGDNLQVHMRTHTKEKPFPCEHCGKAFTTKSHLSTHLRIHTGAKPYSCELCGKLFTYLNLKKRHALSCSVRGNDTV